MFIRVNPNPNPNPNAMAELDSLFEGALTRGLRVE